MDNEFSELQGFSKLPDDPDFKKDIKNYVKNKYKVAFVILPVLYLVVFQIINTVTGVFKDDIDYSRMLVPGLILLGVFVFVGICVYIKYRINVNKLNNSSVDGEVLKSEKQRNCEKEGKGTKCVVILKTEKDKTISVKGKKAQAVYPYVREGDKVRYHYGYPFPVELYNKAECGINICPFCGRENDLKSKKCSRCNNLLLI